MDRFWEKVNKTDSCWLWTASLTDGYGQFQMGGRRYNAHKLSYETLVGPVPQGMCLDHLCRNRACVNPDHLEVVTHKENTRRGANMKHGQSVQGNNQNKKFLLYIHNPKFRDVVGKSALVNKLLDSYFAEESEQASDETCQGHTMKWDCGLPGCKYGTVS